MLAAHGHSPNEPPIPAIVATAIIGLVTLASSAGLAQGRRWSFPVAVGCRILHNSSMLLGLAAHPNPALLPVAAAMLNPSPAPTPPHLPPPPPSRPPHSA